MTTHRAVEGREVAHAPLQEGRLVDAATTARVDRLVLETIERRGRTVTAVSDELEPVLRAAREAAGGGKRIRAALVVWGWRGAASRSVEPDDAVVGVAAGLELFHLAALVHDDVMDRSGLRRGRPTVHRVFEREHRRRGFEGRAADFGSAVATLVGDLCLTWADALVSDALRQLEPSRVEATRRVWDDLRTEVMAGQYLDLLEQQRRGSRLDVLRRVTTYKSAKYTVEQPLLLGAALGGAPAALREGYSAFGLDVGEAFQLRDDLLGVFGDPDLTGKPSGEDLREGKRTLLVALAERRADAVQQRLLHRDVGDAHLDADRLGRLRQVLVETGAVREVEQRIDELVARAHRRLAGLDVPQPVRAALASAASACAWRLA
ncbi:polyprenyl synthetase family protein [Nocardioides marinquilinus]|uniref:Polyprenyl synthetase family protein n=1 Tax=Nocardioides marinquilinus TaxID=1210400 RepID=A0ABP9PGE4_9ACTN